MPEAMLVAGKLVGILLSLFSAVICLTAPFVCSGLNDDESFPVFCLRVFAGLIGLWISVSVIVWIVSIW